MNRSTLIGYATSFASFLLEEAAEGIDNVILFGSVARGDFDKESDIDIFIDTAKNMERSANKALRLFESSSVHNSWELKGVGNKISLKVGKLKEWSLRRDVISSGILLYGKYTQLPDATHYIMVRVDMKGIKPAKQAKAWRRLYGYTQKVGKKAYASGGLVKELGGKKICKGLVVVPMKNSPQLIGFLKKNKVRHTVDELWSDTL